MFCAHVFPLRSVEIFSCAAKFIFQIPARVLEFFNFFGNFASGLDLHFSDLLRSL